MRSKTSCFNPTLFRKTVARFWPVWAFHFAIWFLILPLGFSPRHRDMLSSSAIMLLERDVLQVALYAGLALGASFAVLSAMAVWSFLYSARSVSGTASLPIRREGVFLSVSLAGFLPLLGSTALAFLCYYVSELLQGVATPLVLLQGFAIAALILLFFYGFATLCAQLTGNILVLPAVYAVLNFTAVVVQWLIGGIRELFVYGFSGSMELGRGALTVLSPAVQILLRVRVIDVTSLVAGGWYEITGYDFRGWGWLIGYAAVGLVLTALALLLYRRRRMETAGDVVAIRVLKPIFQYCMTFGCALVFGLLLFYMAGQMQADTGDTNRLLVLLLFMLLGALIGYFSSCMLMEKSFRVFRGGRRWIGLGVSALVITALLLGTEFDVTGYERRVPEAQTVQQVTVTAYGAGNSISFRESEDLAAVQALHESIVRNKSWHEGERTEEYYGMAAPDWYEGSAYQTVRFDYALLGGRTLSRYYALRYRPGDPSTYGDTLTLQQLLNTDKAIAQRKATSPAFTRENLYAGTIDLTLYSDELPALSDRLLGAGFDADDGRYLYYDELPEGERIPGRATLSLTPEECAELYETCILPDIADGTLGRVWLIADEAYRNTVYAVSIGLDARVPWQNPIYDLGPAATDYDTEHFSTVPTVDSVRTVAWLEAHGIPLYTLSEAGE